jgi:hypothetical protein
MNTEEKIVELLKSTNRSGMNNLITDMRKNGFFESPASTRFHGCYKGGLADHVLAVLVKLVDYHSKLDLSKTAPGQKQYKVTGETLIIASLLHDLCKTGAYIGDKKPYKWNKGQPKGHATLSIERAKKFIELEKIEEMMIRYHMGVYGLNEFYKKDDWQTGEYSLRGDHISCEGMSKEDSQAARYGNSMANAWYHNPIVKVMYFCDELATLEAKAQEE